MSRYRKSRLRAIKSLIHRSLRTLGYRLERAPASPTFGFQRIRRLWSTDDPIVQKAKLHLKESAMPADLPSLGDRWGAYASRLRSRIRLVSTAQEMLFLGQSPEAGVENHPRELFGICLSLDLQLLAELPNELYEAFSSFCSPRLIPREYVVEYRGRNLDLVSLHAAHQILTILSWLKGEWPRTVYDLGGGTGKYTASWLTNSAHRPDLVAIVDIPETLVYSETLLRSELGDDKVQFISSPTTAPNKSGVVLCPIGNVRALEKISFDLVTNTASMQEMTDAWVDWYMDWLDRQPCRFFWSSNYFALSLTYMLEGHNSWSPRPSSRWQLVHSQVHFGLRSTAMMLFCKDGNVDGQQSREGLKGMEAWLACLDLARCSKDELLLRQALEFAHSKLPFIPKEAWQVAKMLSEITGLRRDKEAFQNLDLMRKSGTEALH